MSFKKIILIGCTLSLCACTLIPEEQDYTYLPNDAAQSEAYNFAKNTNLLKSYYYGKNIDSKLRDFTVSEIEEMRTELNSYDGSNVSIGLGVMGVLSGNFIDAISIGGGLAAKLGHSDHLPSNSTRLMVELPKADYPSQEKVEQYIINSMETAAEKVLSQYGEVRVTDWAVGGFQRYSVIHDGKDISFGVAMAKQPTGNKDMLYTVTKKENGKSVDYITYGMVGTSGMFTQNTLLLTPAPFMYDVVVREIDTTQFYKEFTAALPKGFYIYVPSFPRYKVDNMTYFDRKFVVPAIFTQGKKYEFIKPSEGIASNSK